MRNPSLKRSMLTWRARWSIPSLLARADERTVTSVVAATNGVLAILVITGLAWWIDLPLLFPALGPSAFILFSSPFSRAAAPRSVIVGHFTAIAAGYATWHLVQLLSGVAVTLGPTDWPALASASLALATTCVLLIRLSCPHAPACATALITALGAANGWPEMLGMAAGVLILTAQAVLVCRVAGMNTPLWFPRETLAKRDMKELSPSGVPIDLHATTDEQDLLAGTHETDHDAHADLPLTPR